MVIGVESLTRCVFNKLVGPKICSELLSATDITERT